MNIHEMIAVVQHYINVRKDTTVQINLQQFENNPFAVMMLNDAYTQAVHWFQSNNLQIDIIR